LSSSSRLRKLLKDHRRFLILCHPNADPDAVCSAAVLRNAIKRIRRGAEVEMASPEGISSISKGIAARFGQEFSEEPGISKADSFFAVDLSNLSQLGDWGEEIVGSGKPMVLIDHHAPDRSTEGSAYLAIIDESATSTCEILYRVMEGLGVRPSRRDLELLFIGIAHETKGFSIATREAFLIASEAVKAGSRPSELFSLMRPQMDRSERIARLKGSQRMELRPHGDWMIALSHVDSFQASVARALVNLGADLAIVGGGKGEEAKVSLRSTEAFSQGTGIHLGRDVAQPVGKAFNGVGGGHSTAAGISGPTPPGELTNACYEVVSALLKRSGRGADAEPKQMGPDAPSSALDPDPHPGRSPCRR
jgi:nanoRNase/pAp phosphatase (c-di-AMP/oligoRNAs hydrolase)